MKRVSFFRNCKLVSSRLLVERIFYHRSHWRIVTNFFASTSFLNLIGSALQQAGHSFTRIDGSMNSMRRIEAVNAFCSDDESSPRFILCSLHAAGTGINLTRGNYAFMMDCWWNQAIENQASKFSTVQFSLQTLWTFPLNNRSTLASGPNTSYRAET